MKLKNIGYIAIVAATAVMFVLGSAVPGEAAKKKKAAAAPPPPPAATCWFTATAPVCGARGTMKFTYANSCYAAKDGAKSVSPGPCKVAKAKKGGAKKAKKATKKKMKK